MPRSGWFFSQTGPGGRDLGPARSKCPALEVGRRIELHAIAVARRITRRCRYPSRANLPQLDDLQGPIIGHVELVAMPPVGRLQGDFGVSEFVHFGSPSDQIRQAKRIDACFFDYYCFRSGCMPESNRNAIGHCYAEHAERERKIGT